MNIVAEKHIPSIDWPKWMQSFSAGVTNKTYNKMDYQLWKKCNRTGESVNVALTDLPSIRLIIGDRSIEVFGIRDKSFGSFLFDMMFNEEEKNMALNNNTGINLTASNSLCDTTLIRDGSNGYSSFITVDKNACNTITNAIKDTTYVYVSDKADKCELDCLASRVSALEAEKKEKEEKKMSMFNFDFGPCTNNDVRLSMYGLAIRNTAGEWVSYNPESKEIINVEIATIKDGGKYMYKMPVAVSDVKVGDIVIHNKVPMFITAVNEDGTFGVTDVRAGETKTIIPTRNMFGFNFVTKIVSLFSTVSTAPTADQPFGNMLPFLMASEGEMDPMAMAVFMSMQGGKNNSFAQNPMMLYFLANSKESNMDPMVMMLMMNGMSK